MTTPFTPNDSSLSYKTHNVHLLLKEGWIIGIYIECDDILAIDIDLKIVSI